MKERIDPRKLRTREMLTKSLVELLQYKPLDSISVQDLVDQCYLSRATFYRNFIDKEDFLKSVMDELLNEMVKCHTWDQSATNKQAGSYRTFFEYINNNAIFFKAFANNSIWPQFRQKYIENGINSYQEIIKQHQDKIIGGYSISFIAHYIVSANAGIIDFWLENGMKESPKYMAEQVTTFTKEGILRIVGLDSHLILPR